MPKIIGFTQQKPRWSPLKASARLGLSWNISRDNFTIINPNIAKKMCLFLIFGYISRFFANCIQSSICSYLITVNEVSIGGPMNMLYHPSGGYKN